MTHKSNILIVEDREDWQDIVCCAVRAEGYIPHSATSYQQAVAALKARKFDLTIIDPVLDRNNRFNRDGLSVIQRVCEIQPETPVMIITGSLTHD
jgi:DNA-binding NtrC family response regulator